MPSPDSTTSTTADRDAQKSREGGDNDGDDVPSSTGGALPPANGNNGNGESHDVQVQKHEGGRHRPRKRKLYAEICKQLEFYFSDANITKNRMMREIIEQANSTADGYVDLSIFLDFTKIQRLTTSLSHIQKALVTSEKLELSSDREKARRKSPFDEKNLKSANAVEECTIYVENIPRDADHEWLERIFQAFGPVAYISLPKFKSGQHKGFAFVEFDDVDASSRCVEAYGEEGGCLPTDIDPSELRSIKTFQEEASENAPSSKSNSEEASSSSKNEVVDKALKRKAGEALAGDECEPKPKKEKREDSSSGVSEEDEAPEKDTGTGIEEVGTTSSSKKKSRKRKKAKTKKSGEAKLESESIVLKVLPKKTWRQLRNRYLNLQRSNMSKVKKQLQREHLRAQHFKNFYQPDASSGHQEDQRPSAYPESSPVVVDHIMEIKLKKPAESSESFRRKISVELAEQDEDEAMISGFIKFVDYKENECQAFVRVNGDDSFYTRADNLQKKAKEAFSSARYLSAEEAEEYKRNVQAALKKKQKEQPRKNVRGKNRLMKAATKSTHIYFGSDDEGEAGEERSNSKGEATKSE